MRSLTASLGLVCLVRGLAACCWPSTWEATKRFMIGTVVQGGPSYLTEGVSDVSVDLIKQKINTITHLQTDNFTIKHRILEDYKEGFQYLIGSNGTCTKSKLTAGVPKQCVPPGSLIMSHSYYGDASTHLNIIPYKLPESLDIYGYMTVTATGCFPISETLHGVIDKTSQMKFTAFLNFTTQIKESSVFDVPHQCSGVNIKILKKTPMDSYKWSMFY